MPKALKSFSPLYLVLIVFAVAVLVLGGYIAKEGMELVKLHGSAYYLIAGIGLITSAILLALRKPAGAWVYAVLLAGTGGWAVWEAGLRFWPLFPRLFAPMVLGLVMLPLLLALVKSPGRRLAIQTLAVALAITVGLLGIGAFNSFIKSPVRIKPAELAAAPAGATPADWRYYGHDQGGRRFAPLDQINKDNVKNLRVAWTYRTGDAPQSGNEDQNTPIQVGDTIYTCSPRNIVAALDAETGREKWRFDPQIKGGFWNRCRAVGYHDSAARPAAAPSAAAPAAPAPAALRASAVPAVCARRIIVSTIDARLLALDAATGAPCPGFGTNGSVDLKVGMGEIKPFFYMPTSSPTVTGDLIIVGGWVADNNEVGEPSGVIRAFNAKTGALVWAWDLGNPTITKLPPAGQTYTRGTPNVWSTPAVDEALGLVYLPTGNATPDFAGSHRTPIADDYTANVVALDIATGRERWRFKTMNHDLWDYDLPSQPMLTDMPDGKGGSIPALIQLTKRGQIFVLDRRTGVPITRVEQRAVPRFAEPGEWTAPTQAYSTGMPAIGAERLSEKQMWGMTTFDHLQCRIEFKKMRYEGEFTAPSTQRSLQYPGWGGGMNWGSGSLDANRGYLIVNDMRMPQYVELVPRADIPRRRQLKLKTGSPQRGTGYSAIISYFLSPYGVPCKEPPLGTLTAIDLKTRQIAWQIPLGTPQDIGPSNLPFHKGLIKTGITLPIGTAGLGGSMTTGSGLIFFGATQDHYLRAFDSSTGRELWRARLPVGGQATPMTYVSPASGRQFVVMSAGGSRNAPDRGDYVIAYALPKSK